MMYRLSEHTPICTGECYLHPSSQIIGQVVLGNKVSIWPQVVLRGDIACIRINDYTNIQDASVLHVNHQQDTIIGKFVTVGHNAIIHGCTIEDDTLIGMGAILLDGCHIERNCLIGAGALVPPGKIISSGSLVMGNPGRIVRSLSKEEIENIHKSALDYWENAVTFINSLDRHNPMSS